MDSKDEELSSEIFLYLTPKYFKKELEDCGSIDQESLKYAASFGKLESIMFAHMNGCKLNHYVAANAAASPGSLNCLMYLFENIGDIENINIDILIIIMIELHNLAGIKYFHDCGVDLTDKKYMELASEEEFYDFIKYSTDNIKKLDIDFYHWDIEQCDLPHVKFIMNNYPKWVEVKERITHADETNFKHFEVLEFMYNHINHNPNPKLMRLLEDKFDVYKYAVTDISDAVLNCEFKLIGMVDE
jgi:hypothetical protein